MLVFASSPTDEPYLRQRRLLQDQDAALDDRDLLTLNFFEHTPAGDARKQFGVEEGAFAVVLVGKDGGEKLRSTEPVRPQDLFDRIEVMPLRWREVRERERIGEPGPK